MASRSMRTVSQNGFSLNMRVGGVDGRQRVTQYGEWSERILTPNPAATRSGTRVGDSIIMSIRDIAAREGVKQEYAVVLGCLNLQVSVMANS